MGYQVDVWSGDLHQRHSASQDFEEWQPATDYMAEQIEAGMLCNVLHTDFKAPPSRGAEAIDALLETLERHEKLIIEGQGVSR